MCNISAPLATPAALRRRKRIYGKGINDVAYAVNPTVNGKRQLCPYYDKWVHMLERCYSKAYHSSHPSYINCTVCHDWLTFSHFRAWMVTQDWEGKQLDKDILLPGNRAYSPMVCVFVPAYLNSLMINHAFKPRRGSLPVGVNRVPNCHLYSACCNHKGNRERLGTFSTLKAASDAYNERKAEIIFEIAMEQTDPRIQNALLDRLYA